MHSVHKGALLLRGMITQNNARAQLRYQYKILKYYPDIDEYRVMPPLFEFQFCAQVISAVAFSTPD